ncbi:hypothetical protein G9F73_010405 [Clostridium estertheticum]|uniref:hypothetical protein n=1 Tax=Clostridium estertheticum TaxID=238834 RepID=UPI0013EEA97C|nr:hypothetical protein [Clostridium estertheticum]MBZ9608216.1 hypothetical protein [Clostridium estertheticum]
MESIIVKLLPNNFRELIASVAIIVSFLFIIISIFKPIREHSLKIIGVLIVSAVALFANDSTCYFLAIIILATLVTNLDFLENISAIVRNSDAYFKFKETQKTPKEVEQSIEKENEAMENALKEDQSNDTSKTMINISLDKSNLTPVQFGLLTEEYTIRYLEGKYGQLIKKYIKLGGAGKTAEFDGIINMKSKDVVLEIKTSKRGIISINYLKELIHRNDRLIREYNSYFKNLVELRFILVGNFTENYKNRVLELKRNEENLMTTVKLEFEFYTFEEIGLEDILNIE